ncbi:unnamed protein product [Moneuplotes crassus]|uniref:Uncharacterized protein n=1 Tax=Euplotes crassus TaxID=5936 RepID=A0AAD1UMZ8_EUPCR|nr:unnamed protein product [Moneuplotes crassus]
MEGRDEIDQEKYYQRISREESLLVESIEQQYQRCCDIYCNALLRNIKASLPDPESDEHCVNFSLGIHFGKSIHMKLPKNLKFLKFFNVDKVILKIDKCQTKHALNFIDFSFPDKTNVLYISLTGKMKLSCGIYFNSLARISSKVTQSVTLQWFCLNLHQLKRFVAAYKHVERLEVKSCKLSIPKVPDFSKALQNCKVQIIDLWRTGDYSYSNWRDHLDEFKNLVQGFSTSPDLKLSLREVCIWNCGIKENEAEDIFAENQLEGVKLMDGS